MTTALPHRALAMLRAVRAGRAELTDSCEPDLRVDGLACCDQEMARSLVHAGLVATAGTGPKGAWLPAILTPAGEAALTSTSAALGPPTWTRGYRSLSQTDKPAA